VRAWQNGPRDVVYPVMFIDAIVVKIREGQIASRPIYVAVGMTRRWSTQVRDRGDARRFGGLSAAVGRGPATRDCPSRRSQGRSGRCWRHATGGPLPEVGQVLRHRRALGWRWFCRELSNRPRRPRRLPGPADRRLPRALSPPLLVSPGQSFSRTRCHHPRSATVP
jgi:hypothetical protein